MPGAANFQAKQTREGVPPSQLIFPPKNEGEYIRATQEKYLSLHSFSKIISGKDSYVRRRKYQPT